MLEEPNLPNELIINCLQQHYGLQVVRLEFLPIGNDATAWVYKVSAANHTTYFLKVKSGNIEPASITIPHYLYEAGITQVVSPIPNQTDDLCTPLQAFTLILYPYIDGQMGMDVGLSLQQWQELGTTLKRIHTTRFPREMIQQVSRETFILNPKWTTAIQTILQILSEATFKDILEEQLASFWHDHYQEIDHITSRTQELGRLLQAQSLPFVLCHADIHTANVLIDRAGELFIVDWDGTLFAPKERDLMFVISGRVSSSPQNESEQAFLNGYGQPDINRLAIAYYRYEWVVQEIADFGERVFLTPDIGAATKQDAVRGFKQLFLPSDVVASAYASEAYL